MHNIFLKSAILTIVCFICEGCLEEDNKTTKKFLKKAPGAHICLRWQPQNLYISKMSLLATPPQKLHSNYWVGVYRITNAYIKLKERKIDFCRTIWKNKPKCLKLRFVQTLLCIWPVMLINDVAAYLKKKKKKKKKLETCFGPVLLTRCSHPVGVHLYLI